MRPSGLRTPFPSLRAAVFLLTPAPTVAGVLLLTEATMTEIPEPKTAAAAAEAVS